MLIYKDLQKPLLITLSLTYIAIQYIPRNGVTHDCAVFKEHSNQYRICSLKPPQAETLQMSKTYIDISIFFNSKETVMFLCFIQAYQKHKKENGDERLLPGLNATNDQLFFLGFAQVE